jgi:two-component SAPR family response regulator
MFPLKSDNKFPHVVIIDDDDISMFITRTMIERSGSFNAIHTFNKAEEALTFLKEKESRHNSDTIEFIFLNIRMPLSNGFMFLDKLKELDLKITSEVKVVMLSNLISPDDAKRCSQYKQIIEIVEKPLKEETLQKIINAAIH